MSVPSKLCYFHQIYDASFFLPASNELHSHCKLDHPASHWQVRDVCVGGDFPQLKKGMGCSALAALHVALSSFWLSSHSWVTAPHSCTFPCPSCWCLIPCGTPSSPVVSVPVQCFQLGAASAFCPTHFQSCPCGASYLTSREQRDFSRACHKEKSKTQAIDEHFDLLPLGKIGQ